MQRLYVPAQMREIDRELIEGYGIPGIELMERAASGVTDAVLRIARPDNRIAVVCGKGNNGGDGLAVLRQLCAAGRRAFGVLLCAPEAYHGDAKTNYERAVACGCPIAQWEPGCLSNAAVIVDAIFGTGFSGTPQGDAQTAIRAINACGVPVIAVDIPSGADGASGRADGDAVRASETVTFQYEKPGLFLFPGRSHAGTVTLHRIAGAETSIPTALYRIEECDLSEMLPERPLDSHKGSNGRALLLAGSERYTGAALLTSAAALRGGAGLLSVAVPQKIKPAFSSLPEAMCIPVGTDGDWDESACREAEALIGPQQAIGIGCGMGRIDDAMLLQCILDSGIPAVFDADALNALAVHRELLGALGPQVILTPHPAEMARLLGCETQEVLRDPVGVASAAARAWGCTVLLKGATSCITDGEHAYLNTMGNPGLAKGGSGDTLTGLILALLAQGLSPVNAGCAGAYLLGASANTAYQILGNRMLVASDVTAAIETTVGNLYRK